MQLYYYPFTFDANMDKVKARSIYELEQDTGKNQTKLDIDKILRDAAERILVNKYYLGDNNENLVVEVALPGFKYNDIQAFVKGSSIYIQSNGIKEKSDKDYIYLYQGIDYSKFEKKIDIFDYTKVDSAVMADGLLTIKFSKKEDTSKIQIKVEEA